MSHDAQLIGLGTKQVYEEALPTTTVIIESSTIKDKTICKTLGNNNSECKLPRYDKFNWAITNLAKQGCVFKEIAGNTSAILITVLAPNNFTPKFENVQVVFTQPIASNLQLNRIDLATPVYHLNKLLLLLNNNSIKIEHIYDF